MCKSIICCLLITPLFAEFSLSSLSLEGAEAIAMEHNKSFQIAEQITDTASERKNQAVSRFLPKIHYQAEMRTIDKKLFSSMCSLNFQNLILGIKAIAAF